MFLFDFCLLQTLRQQPPFCFCALSDFPVNQFNVNCLHSISTFFTQVQLPVLFGINWRALSQWACWEKRLRFDWKTHTYGLMTTWKKDFYNNIQTHDYNCLPLESMANRYFKSSFVKEKEYDKNIITHPLVKFSIVKRDQTSTKHLCVATTKNQPWLVFYRSPPRYDSHLKLWFPLSCNKDPVPCILGD